MAEMNMTDFVEYNIYLTGWDTKLVWLDRIPSSCYACFKNWMLSTVTVNYINYYKN